MRSTIDPASVSPRRVAAFQDYLAVQHRTIRLPEQAVAARLRGRTVLVTGAAGCIGRALLAELARYGPARVVGAGLEEAPRLVPGVEHHRQDVRDRAGLTALVRRVRPDLVFHLAAQRDPGLAEREAGLTVTTNVLGTGNVIDACAAAGVGHLVYASTGKALRPYTSDVYAQSKRTGEWLVADAAAGGRLPGAAVRFTHVVDNAIVLDRFRAWCRAGRPLRLHDRDTVFYVQSARESARLLLTAALAPRDELFRLYAIRDLGWPVSLLDLAHGAIAEQSRTAEIHVVGHEPGYEKCPYPGLYDPRCSGGVSPLVNGLEAPDTAPGPGGDVDCVTGRPPLTPGLRRSFRGLRRLCGRTGPAAGEEEVRAVFDALAWELLDHAVACAPSDAVRRIARCTAAQRETMSDEHRGIDDLFRKHAGLPVGSSATAGVGSGAALV
ncbi:NAD(P)-dependent oxidoreductase [Streptomyces sp. JJ36]|uniref:NAD-dependent epimerase/dehydratase family protein n=1 Tax=Streptomyces sp. JJ36 TaxID=2736645 RepID=UPI001F27AF9F|nr:polysaccharide biosynthesis protein [Streptomyces sp. JJ36]MCF6523716.1 polysaccharide biosynthesis protein [Streptomyces sp. JJ36]